MNLTIPMQSIIEIEPMGDDIVMVTAGTGETYELDTDAFAVLTGRDWQDFVTER